jgi:copper chaperone CopZ
MKKSVILKEEFGYREGFGVCGKSLKVITKRIAELYGSKHVQINVPYSNFNCKGTANRIAKEVSGLMPFAKERLDIEKATTLFYDNEIVNKRKYYLPFQSNCDVFFVDKVRTENNVVVVDLMKAPNWRAYL